MAGTIVADTIQDGAGNSTAMDNAIYGSAKAWVNFNANSPITIRASYNVSSITYNSTQQYILNFTNAFVDTNYVVIWGVNPYSTGGFTSSGVSTTNGNTAYRQKTTTTCWININNNGTGSPDYFDNNIVVLR